MNSRQSRQKPCGRGGDLARRLDSFEAFEGAVPWTIHLFNRREPLRQVEAIFGNRVLAVTGVIARADARLVVDIPGEDRRVVAETRSAVGDQLIPSPPILRVVNAGAQPAVVMVVDGVGLALAVDDLGVGKLVEKAVVDIEGCKTEEHAESRFLAEIQQAGHLVQAAVEANADADRVKASIFDHLQVAAPVSFAVGQPFGACRHAAKRVFIVGADPNSIAHSGGNLLFL